jgi:hypothetical protein
LQVNIQLSQQHLLKRLPSPLNGLGTFVKNQLTVGVWAYSWTPIHLTYISILIPAPHNLVVSFCTNQCESSLSFFWIVSGYSVFLEIPYEFWNQLDNL